MMFQIREYETRDFQAVRACFVALQEHERGLDPRIPAGEAIADAYLPLMFDRSRQHDGKVFVAVQSGEIAGFVTVWARVRSTEPDDDPTEYAFVSDLVVLPLRRRRGIGRALLAVAEEFARSRGRSSVRLHVKGGNESALAFYRSAGFQDFELELEKRLRARPDERAES